MNALLLRTLAAAAAGLLALTASAAAHADAAHIDDTGLVRTGGGLLRGTVTAETRSFQGIPYAAPPVGDLRWRAPEPAAPWDGVRDAAAPGAPCLQPSRDPGAPTGSEDCLYLDVHTPNRAAGPLPVLVFLHGGGLRSGSGDMYDPVRIVERGEAVVVTLNYRLGALGWLAHPDLDDPDAGNFGLADQQAALAWVREEIAAFGGDPGNVTLWGQSAGGRSVCAQLAAPGAAGLFDKAIVQSAPCGNAVVAVEEAERRGLAHAAALGCDGADAESCLREADPADLVALAPDDGLHRRAADLPWSPVAGTEALPLQPLAAMRRGLAADVPLLHGGTSDEMRSIVYGAFDGLDGPVTEAEYPRVVEDLYGGRTARAILAKYPAGDYGSPSIALATLLTDDGGQLGICSQLPALEAAAQYAPAYAYEFAEPTEPYNGFPFGANHSSDLGYFFDTPFGPRPEGDRSVLSEAMIDHWTAFAVDGDPGWPEYERRGAYTFAAAGSGMADMAAGHHCGFWNRLS
ncbi:carboxylesterase family protein [Glycomyces sp. A-F 0318]|uniref:carboxylesterase/lipase family protein n=1 Tax=Glycomyces amatae TaxID=2881355 RepID=UPI001E5BB282|nr:carboxylesterase family protein [Glycomyces amatae]MCD0443237.1 carboxylesterase family protein [Glycomyces amatae]